MRRLFRLIHVLELSADRARAYRQGVWAVYRGVPLLAGLGTRSAISRHNPASFRSHQAVADFAVIDELPNDYLMIEFPRVRRERPVLGV